MIEKSCLRKIRSCMADDFGEENINNILMDWAYIDVERRRTFPELMKVFAKRYDIEIKIDRTRGKNGNTQL